MYDCSSFKYLSYFVYLTHVLHSVYFSKQMMDLTIQLAASNKLSPTGYRIDMYNEETGKHIEFLASQTIGHLCMQGCSALYLVSKKSKVAQMKERKSSINEQPFEVSCAKRLHT